MNRPRSLRRAPIALIVPFVALCACSAKDRGASETKTSAAAAQTVAKDDHACEDICSASQACGDEPSECRTRCREWLVQRSRPGIASATAKCAVPRIDMACEDDSDRGAAKALVLCVDEAGREKLRGDKSALLVAARAICERGARCNGGDSSDAQHCVDKISNASAPPKGLGIFGAMRPEHVQEFATCMSTVECGPAAATCFGEMLGEDMEEPDSAPAEGAPPDEGVPDTTKILGP